MTKLNDLPPLLPTPKALWLAGCSRSTLERSGIKPVGRRGKSLVWNTADILRWMGVEQAG